MTKVITGQNPEGSIKVSRKVVDIIQALAEARAEQESAKARVEELRKAILAEVGEYGDKATLVHHNIEVARITKQVTPRPDLTKLKTEFPEIWESVRYDSVAEVIRAVTRTK